MMRRIRLFLFKWKRLLPITMLLAGACAILVGIGADLLGIGGGGFGAKQFALSIVGFALLLIGTVLSTAIGRRYLRGWQAMIAADTTPASILLIAVWFGLLAGWGEVLIRFVRRAFTDGRIFWEGVDIHLFWIIPLAHLVLFTGLGLVLSLIGKLWSKPIVLKSSILVLALIGISSILFALFDKLHIAALLVLAAGLGVQFARLVDRHPAGFFRLVRFSTGWPVFFGRSARKEAPQPVESAAGSGSQITRRQFVAGAGAGVLATALAIRGWPSLTENLSRSKLPLVRAAMPNVLLVVLDTVRAQSLSLHGYHRPTSPNLERLARMGARFDRALSTSPWTLPSHASMFTGRFPHELTANWLIPLDDSYPTLAEALSSIGYLTAGFAANPRYCSRPWGLSRGFLHYEDTEFTLGQVARQASIGQKGFQSLKFEERFANHQNFGRISAEKLNRAFLRWLHRNRGGAPFFAFLNYFDAHDPFLPPREFARRFGTGRQRGFVTEEIAQTLPSDTLQEMNDAYDACIAYLDHHIGLLFDELQALGMLSNTLVIITSDHGEHFGDHGLIYHGNSLYVTLLHVPLLVLFPPQIPEDTVVHHPVTLRSLPATIMDVLGQNHGIGFPGNTLNPHWRVEAREAEGSEDMLLSNVKMNSELPGPPVTRGNMHSLVSGNLHYIKHPDDREELYDFESDPWETLDLTSVEQLHPALERFRITLDTMLGRS